MIAALVLGALVGFGLIVSWRLLFPAPPPLQAAIDRLNRRNELVGITNRGKRDEQASDLFGRTVDWSATRSVPRVCGSGYRAAALVGTGPGAVLFATCRGSAPALTPPGFIASTLAAGAWPLTRCQRPVGATPGTAIVAPHCSYVGGDLALRAASVEQQ